jgi:hypothetical protein
MLRCSVGPSKAKSTSSPDRLGIFLDHTYSPQQTTLHADREHSGIQFTMPLIILAAWVGVYLLIDPLLLEPLSDGGDLGGYRSIVRIVLTIVIGLAIGELVESLLKRTWSSGRQLRLDADGLTVAEKGKSSRRIQWGKRVNTLLWQYPLRGYSRGGRERRVPASHSLYACRLLQDEVAVIAYSYLAPRQQKAQVEPAHFVELDMSQLREPGVLKRFSPLERPAIPPVLLTGKHGQLWAAEKERWQVGFELDPADYAILIGELMHHGILSPTR